LTGNHGGSSVISIGTDGVDDHGTWFIAASRISRSFPRRDSAARQNPAPRIIIGSVARLSPLSFSAK